uniref:Uncharacterized protein n=1 Tax=Knipowitschia caucasica TaxID=637954 RepID=A0AAV2KG51_KNICA
MRGHSWERWPSIPFSMARRTSVSTAWLRYEHASPPQYYSSRQTLVSSPSQTHIPDDNMQSGQLFYVGLPSSYSLEAPMPRLPSYESVRKKDRQKHIHKLIADRFGLSGSMPEEPPPSYEESVGRSVEVLHSSDQLCSDTADPHMSFTNGGFNNYEDPPAAPCDPSNGLSPL